MLWCLKTVVYGNQVRFESLKNSAGTSTKSDKCCIVIYTFIQHHNDTIPKTNAWRITHEGRRKKTSLTTYFTSHFIARVRKGCWRFACERMLETEHKLHILTPLLWPSRCVFIVLLMLGSTPSGLFRGPPRSGVAFLTTSGLYCLELSRQLPLGFSEGPLGRVWPSLPHLVSNPLGVCWQLLWDPNSTELNNNSTPTRSPTGSLQSNV